ncbi:hypothetical protein V5799_022763 [Amblyomma americanum]|uniref:Uncharacterized protein n=1 Tax=Amblyomma americanum TaxID=6943 RepID=A0AAQ4FJT5_AMBAM
MTLRAHGASRDASSEKVVPPIECPPMFDIPQEPFHASLHQLKLSFRPLTSSITVLGCVITEGLEAYAAVNISQRPSHVAIKFCSFHVLNECFAF